MNHIALDLELEQPYDNPQTPDSKLDVSKIIQVGWVVFNTKNNSPNILKKCSYHVNIGVPLSKFIKDLTRITDEEVANGKLLVEVYNELATDREEFNTSRIVRQWGHGDMSHMKMELETETPDNVLKEHNFKWEFGMSGLNVKHLYQTYALANGMNFSGGLSKSLGRCGLLWEGKGKHDALIDALNTANMYNFLECKMRR